MIAVDTNVLVYAHRVEAPHHERAAAALASLAGSRWAIPWACVHEFVAVVTNARIFTTATPTGTAFEAMSVAQDAGAVFLAETSDHLTRLAGLLAKVGRDGTQSARRAHRVRLPEPRGQRACGLPIADFGYFPELRTRNPLVD